MRGPKLVSLCAIVVAVAAVGAAGATTPRIAAKRAQAQRVLAQINAIDERLSVVTEQFDGARVHLQAVRAQLRVEQRALGRARRQDRRAKLAEARLLVQLYVSDRPSTLEVLLGVHSLSDLISLSDAERAITLQVTSVAAAATRAQLRLERAVQAVQAARAVAARTVRELAAKRREIERGLAQRRTLLASVQAEISRLEAQQRARQARLAAEARARLAAAAAARARAAAEAAARARALAARRAQARAAAAAAAAARAQTAATTTTTTAAATAAAATTTTVAAPAPIPSFDPPPPSSPEAAAGHPQAAQVALQYIGVPYVWGGASPSGFDCSGFVSYVFAQLGVSLPHHAADQYTYGVPVAANELQPGDLVFFDGLNHVGIYIGNGQYVDAPDTGSFVRIDSLADPWAVTNYVGARRV